MTIIQLIPIGLCIVLFILVLLHGARLDKLQSRLNTEEVCRNGGDDRLAERHWSLSRDFDALVVSLGRKRVEVPNRTEFRAQ